MKYPAIILEYMDYMESIRSNSPGTVKEYSYDISMFLKFLLYRLQIVNVKTSEIIDIDIENFPNEILNNIKLIDLHSFIAYLDRTHNNISTTRSRKISSIKSFYKYLYNVRRIVDSNPAELLESPKKQTRNPVYFTLDEAIRLLKTVNLTEDEFLLKRDRAILILFLNCGMRLSELVNIDVDHIKDDTIKVIGKGNKERTIYLNNSCNRAIDDYLKIRPDIDNEPALFLSVRNKRISNRAVQYRIEHYIKLAGFDHTIYSTHKLRHTAATLMFKHGNVDIRILQEILGHKSVATTEIYTHLDDDSLRGAVNKNPLGDMNF